MSSAASFQTAASYQTAASFVTAASSQSAASEDDNSSLAEDTEYERSDLLEDSGRCETQEVREVQKAPVDTHGRGAAFSGVYSGGRRVQSPYSERQDVGGFGIYVGNWSGRRKMQLINDHLGADLIARNAAQILIAQEVDPKFIASLREPGSSREATSAPQKVAGQDTPAVVGYRQGRHFHERPVNLSPWHVAEASEGSGSEASTLIIAARSSLAKSSTVVEWQKLFHCDYKRNGKTHLAYSRILCAQVVWNAPMHGREAVQILNVHFHNLVAKKELRPSTQNRW